MVEVRVENAVKQFADVVAVDNASLEIRNGEFFTILGPSGCGKTTLLRLIAGLEFPDAGRIFFDSEDVTNAPPYQRGTGMVFQNYALWPHMSVYENVAYGLELRHLTSEEISKKVNGIIEFVKLGGTERKFPTQLSGGQQQRVALARALVIEPKLLLLDEPLSNLDAKLRVEMREEIKRIQRELGITAAYVTHDQEEAMVLSDRMAIMNKGTIVQVASPLDAYKKPANLFVASFLGRCNMISGVSKEADEGRARVAIGKNEIVGMTSSRDLRIDPGSNVSCVIRPESFSLAAYESSNVFKGTVEWASFAGSYNQLRIRTEYGDLLANIGVGYDAKIGDLITLYVPYSEVIVIPLEKGEEIAYARELATR